MELTRRAFLATVGSAGLAGCAQLPDFGSDDGSRRTTATDTGTTVGSTTALSIDRDGSDIQNTEYGPAVADTRRHLSQERSTFREQASSSGTGKERIPSIDDPTFVDATQAGEFLVDEDVVFGLQKDGVVKAYPQRILVYHEIVNDTVDGDPLSVTYCPLTGTVLGFDPGGTVFGVSGFLVNSNLIMYDRWTEAWWPQILATAIPGRWNDAPGHYSLRETRLVWTTWERWRALHPDTRVLSRHTGYIRQYDRPIDPYGSYQPNKSGYYTDSTIAYPRFHKSGRYHPKRVVMGVRTGEGAAAFLKDALREQGTLTGEVGGASVVAVYDPRLDTAYVYRIPDENEVDLEGERAVLDGSEHDPDALPLEEIHAFDAMWFAWYGFYPDTEVYE